MVSGVPCGERCSDDLAQLYVRIIGRYALNNLACKVEEADFDRLVVARSHETPVLVDISADWCAPCRVLAPLLHKLVAAYGGKFILGMVDADENMKIAGRHKVKGFPTVVAYSHGVEIDRFHSAQTEGFLREFINRVIERHAAGAQQTAHES